MAAYRYLRGNKAEWGPSNVLCVDTETCRESPDGQPGHYNLTFKVGCAIAARRRGNRYSRSAPLLFWDREDFWREVERLARPRQTLWLFAHNIGFDSITLGFWQLLDCGRFVRQWPRDRSKGSKSGDRQSELASGLLVTSDPPTIVECWTRRGAKIRMVDTLNYFSASLGAIGEWVGLSKLPMPDPWASREDWEVYCQRDTEVLIEAVLKYVNWVSENQLGMFAMTLPSQAMHGYRHTSTAKGIVIHDMAEAQALEGEAYRGGEVLVGRLGAIYTGPGTSQMALGEVRDCQSEVFTRGIHHLDTNSLFPAVMRSGLYPRRLIEYEPRRNASKSLVEKMGQDCIAECLVHSDQFGIYSRRNGRSGRFTGTFVACLAGPELAVAIANGHVVAVRRYARYELADLFSSWVDRWWVARWSAQLAGRQFDSLLCKKIMNSLYGKFAQKAYEWEDCECAHNGERWGSWIDLDMGGRTLTHYRSIAGTVQRRATSGYHKDAFVAIAAFVTSYAREHMRELRNVSGNKSVYYQGIDSLYVSDAGLANLRVAGKVDPGRLGALRHEESADTADFLGWGLYRFGNKYIRTSIGRGAIECHPGEFEQENFTRLGQYINNVPVEGVPVQTVHKTLAASSPVGIVGEDGWVSPLPARWGDNHAETHDPREYYGQDMGDWCNQTIAAYTR